MTKRKDKILQAKKDTVLKQQNRKNSSMPIVLGVLVLVGAAAAGYYLTNGTAPASHAQVSTSTGNLPVGYPASMFEDGLAHQFEYKAGDLTIRYFILKSSDGVIRAAFDACDVCWPAGKGYYQDGDDMVCRNCGRRFASVLVNEVQGGCNPAPLKRTLKGDQLRIDVDDILQGKTYFNFKGKA